MLKEKIMDYKTIKLDRKGPIDIITLNRSGSLNAFSYEMIDEMIDALDSLDKDLTTWVLVIKAEGRAFCSGHDISESLVPEGKTIEERIQLLEDKEAIRELCTKYCYYVDAFEFDKVVDECYTEDILFQRPPYVYQGKEEVRAFHKTLKYTMMCHMKWMFSKEQKSNFSHLERTLTT